MKLLIDTSLPKMLLILFKGNEIIFSFTSDDKKKADLLPKIFNKMLNNCKITTSDINEFYVTKGPGSFMGSRTALTFVRTICQITKAKLFLANTLEFIGAKSENNIFVDAKNKQSYMFDPISKETTLVVYETNSKINYEDILKNVNDYLLPFKEVNPDKAKTFYLKDPRIGG